jgi:hypothetical protein
MLSDEEARAIETSAHPRTQSQVLVAWIQELLRDRSERVAQINEVRSRLEQAFRYLTGLCAPRFESERSKKERDQRMRNS